MRDAEREVDARRVSGPRPGKIAPGNGNGRGTVSPAPAGFTFEIENRQFTRIATQVPVELKFFSSQVEDDRMLRTYRGTTTNLSAGGMLLNCLVPDPAWIPDLLLGRVVLGLKIQLVPCEEPVKAMARVAWIEDPGQRGDPHGLGVRFREITREGHDRLLTFIIDSEI